MNMTDGVFIHERALVEARATIGVGTRVWANVHILGGAVIGDDCNICDQVFIENDVVVGNRVTIKSGVQLWDGIHLEDDVFVGPNATFTNDPFPRSRAFQKVIPRTYVRRGASIGANATILPGVSIGVGAMVGAGSVVTRDVPPNAIVVGNPARITGYVTSEPSHDRAGIRDITSPRELAVERVRLVRLPRIVDMRGGLSFGEFPTHLPFQPQRYFIIFDVPTSEIRGEHAHKDLHQFLICVRGTCSVVVDDGVNREEIVLNEPDVGLYVGPMVWATQYKYSSDAVMLVLASDVYDAEDYIRDYDEFLRKIK